MEVEHVISSTRVLRVVTLASRTGKYGGPTDTAVRQAHLVMPSVGKVRVIAGALPSDELEDPLVETVRVRQWIPRAGYSGLFSWAIARRLVRASRSADVVHISMAREMIPVWAAVVSLLRRKRVILQPHGMLTSRSSSWHKAVDTVLRPLVRRADELIALTSEEEAALRRWLREPDGSVRTIRVIGNPSPYAEVRVAPAPVAFFAARLHPRKCVTDFVEAARIANEHRDEIEYVVAGPDQGDGDVVREAARSLPNFRYLGGISSDAVVEELSGASVFVLPSRDEPWGNVLASAVKSHIPVVVTRSAALASELERMRAATVVPDGEASALRDAIRSAVETREAFMEQIDRVAVASRFGNDGIKSQLIGVYEFARR